ncbi:MAG: hypothetical protein ABI091_26675 [Ferruginibacter sp.]
MNVINLPERNDRLESFKEQAEIQGFNFRVWQGKIDLVAVFRAISDAHKQIVIDAKINGLNHVCIAEDDIKFNCKGAWNYYLENIPKEFDLYLGMVYEGKIENNKLVNNPYTFSGLSLYTVSSRFYDRFLSMNSMAHLDKELGKFAGRYDYYVVPEFVCYQMDGYSDQKKKDCKYDHLLKGRKLFGV